MIKWLLSNKLVIGMGLAYMILQLVSIWYTNIGLLIGYFLCYLALIGYLAFGLLQGSNDLKYKVAFIGIVNLILFLIYLPLFVFNPEINWYLRGENEADPMLLYVFVPVFLFFLGSVILFFANLGYNLFTSSK